MRLQTMSPEAMQTMFDNMEKECDQIKRNVIQASWYMRGGASVDDIMNMSFSEREMINDLITENLKVTKESQMPFF